MEKYRKIRFYKNSEEFTAGIVVPSHVFNNRTMSEMSEFFPKSEWNKMHKFEYSPEFNTFDAAFLYEF